MQEKRGRRVPVAHNQGADRSGSGESLVPFLMQFSFVSPEGGTETTEDGRDIKSRFPDAVLLRFPGRGNRNHWGRKRYKK